MSSYWDALERYLNEAWGEPAGDVAAGLIERGWAPADNRAELTSLLSEHDGTYSEDPDDEWNFYCVCGKWLERDAYEMPDHVSSVLEDSGLLSPGDPWAVGEGKAHQ